MIVFFIGLIVIQVLMVFVWTAAYRINKTSIVDIFWSLLIWAAATLYFLVLSTHTIIAGFYYLLVSIWSFRLAGYIFWRARGHAEDARYQALRAGWGRDEKKRMFI